MLTVRHQASGRIAAVLYRGTQLRFIRGVQKVGNTKGKATDLIDVRAVEQAACAFHEQAARVVLGRRFCFPYEAAPRPLATHL